MLKLAALSLVFLVLIACSQAYRKCKDVKTVPVDEEWYDDAAAVGFNLLKHSNCENCENKEDWKWLKQAGRAPRMQKKCWTLRVNTAYKDFKKVPYVCKYNNVNDQNCQADFSKTDAKHNIEYGGRAQITHTDNETYVAGTTCIFGKENVWWIMTADEGVELPVDIQEDIDADFIKQGFHPDNVATKDSVIQMKRLASRTNSCPRRSKSKSQAPMPEPAPAPKIKARNVRYHNSAE